MNNSTWQSRLQAVGSEYLAQGYRVIFAPNDEELPPFLSGLRPDLVAYGDDNNVIVEVKAQSVSLGAAAANALIARMAAILEDRPGWRFELVVAGSQERHDMDTVAQDLDQQEIQDRLAEVNQLVQLNYHDAAIAVAWAAVEASMRLLARRNGVELQGLQPLVILKQLYSLGLTDRRDYDALQEAMKVRNLVVHGFNSTENVGATVGILTEIAGRFLQEQPSGATFHNGNS